MTLELKNGNNKVLDVNLIEKCKDPWLAWLE